MLEKLIDISLNLAKQKGGLQRIQDMAVNSDFTREDIHEYAGALVDHLQVVIDLVNGLIG